MLSIILIGLLIIFFGPALLILGATLFTLVFGSGSSEKKVPVTKKHCWKWGIYWY